MNLILLETLVYRVACATKIGIHQRQAVPPPKGTMEFTEMGDCSVFCDVRFEVILRMNSNPFRLV